MNILIQTLSHSPLQFGPELPKGFEGKCLPGSELQLAKGSLGTNLIQQIKDEQYCQLTTKVFSDGRTV